MGIHFVGFCIGADESNTCSHRETNVQRARTGFVVVFSKKTKSFIVHCFPVVYQDADFFVANFPAVVPAAQEQQQQQQQQPQQQQQQQTPDRYSALKDLVRRFVMNETKTTVKPISKSKLGFSFNRFPLGTLLD